MEKKRNLWVIPTEKPSRLFEDDLQLYYSKDKNRIGSIISNQHIYITSDEEIKEGDWYLDTFNTQRIKANQFSDHKHYGSACQKIILTTDQDLIKDGVQAIDDEFLEWFVKNPSCEEVEVTYRVLKPFQSENKGYLIHCPDNEVLEEPKQETQGYICPRTKKQCDDECCVSAKDCHLEASMGVLSEPKQETLEEAVQKVANIDDFINGALFGSKWQQERMYSEEEVINIFFLGRESLHKALVTKEEALDIIKTNKI